MRDYEYQQLPDFDPESPFMANQNPAQPPVGPDLPLPQSQINPRYLTIVWFALPLVVFVSQRLTIWTVIILWRHHRRRVVG